VRAALAVLKGRGYLTPRELGPTDLEEVEWDMALEVVTFPTNGGRGHDVN
jgi:hypothetical protein